MSKKNFNLAKIAARQFGVPTENEDGTAIEHEQILSKDYLADSAADMQHCIDIIRGMERACLDAGDLLRIGSKGARLEAAKKVILIADGIRFLKQIWQVK